MALKRIKIKPCDLHIDHSYQRQLDGTRITAMALEFHPERIGVPVCSKRRDGTLWILDGQHRVALLKCMELEDEPILVEYHEDMTVREEAREFDALNAKGIMGRLPVHVLSRFQARLVGAYATEVAVNRILHNLGLHLAMGKGGTAICAVQAVEWVHEYNNNLAAVLTILRDWGASEQGAVFDRTLIKGVSNFLHHYPQVNTKHLLSRLQTRAPVNVTSLIKTAASQNMPSWAAACYVLRGIYNTRAKVKLDPLDWNNIST